MEGVTQTESFAIQDALENAKRFVASSGATRLGIRLKKLDGEGSGSTGNEGSIGRRLVLDDARTHDEIEIVAAKCDFVRRVDDEDRRILYVTDVTIDAGQPQYAARSLDSVIEAGGCTTGPWLLPRPLPPGHQIEASPLLLLLRCGEIELAMEVATFDSFKSLVVLPLTQGEDCSFAQLLGAPADGCVSASAHKAGGGEIAARRATHFFSWSFAQQLRRFVEAFAAFLANKQLDERSCFAWISPLSEDQHAIHDYTNADWGTIFEKRLHSIGHLVLLFSPWYKPAPLGRMWCLWELFIASSNDGITITVQLPPQDEATLTKAVLHSEVSASMLISGISTAKANARDPAAEVMIRARIEASGGYNAVDEAVRDGLKRALVHEIPAHCSAISAASRARLRAIVLTEGQGVLVRRIFFEIETGLWRRGRWYIDVPASSGKTFIAVHLVGQWATAFDGGCALYLCHHDKMQRQVVKQMELELRSNLGLGESVMLVDECTGVKNSTWLRSPPLVSHVTEVLVGTIDAVIDLSVVEFLGDVITGQCKRANLIASDVLSLIAVRIVSFLKTSSAAPYSVKLSGRKYGRHAACMGEYDMISRPGVVPRVYRRAAHPPRFLYRGSDELTVDRWYIAGENGKTSGSFRSTRASHSIDDLLGSGSSWEFANALGGFTLDSNVRLTKIHPFNDFARLNFVCATSPKWRGRFYNGIAADEGHLVCGHETRFNVAGQHRVPVVAVVAILEFWTTMKDRRTGRLVVLGDDHQLNCNPHDPNAMKNEYGVMVPDDVERFQFSKWPVKTPMYPAGTRITREVSALLRVNLRNPRAVRDSAVPLYNDFNEEGLDGSVQSLHHSSADGRPLETVSVMKSNVSFSTAEDYAVGIAKALVKLHSELIDAEDTSFLLDHAMVAVLTPLHHDNWGGRKPHRNASILHHPGNTWRRRFEETWRKRDRAHDESILNKLWRASELWQTRDNSSALETSSYKLHPTNLYLEVMSLESQLAKMVDQDLLREYLILLREYHYSLDLLGMQTWLNANSTFLVRLKSATVLELRSMNADDVADAVDASNRMAEADQWLVWESVENFVGLDVSFVVMAGFDPLGVHKAGGDFDGNDTLAYMAMTRATRGVIIVEPSADQFDIFFRVQAGEEGGYEAADAVSLGFGKIDVVVDSTGHLRLCREKVNASGQKLTEIPEDLLDPVRGAMLLALDLSKNSMTSLPDSICLLTRLRSLNLSRNQISTVPPSIRALTGLQELHLAGNQITILPPAICALQELTLLDISQNPLVRPQTLGIEAWFWTIKERGTLTGLHDLKPWHNRNAGMLREVDLIGQGFTVVPDDIGLLTGAHTIDISDNLLMSLPDSLWTLITVQHLNLESNRFVVLADSLGALTNLESLNLSSNELIALPDSIGELVHLEFLHLTHNALVNLPESIGGLTGLTSLDLDDNRLLTLPLSIGLLVGLENLNLTHNSISSLPDTIGDLTRLTRLDVSQPRDAMNTRDAPTAQERRTRRKTSPRSRGQSGGLTRLPDSIGSLIALEELYLESCNLLTLPASIGALLNLKKVNLAHNELIALPDSFGGLLSLVELDISGNALTMLPRSVGALRSLVELDLSKNQLKELPSELAILENLRNINLRMNELISLPEFGSFASLETLDVSSNALEGLPNSILESEFPPRFNADKQVYEHVGLARLDVSYNPKLRVVVEEIAFSKNMFEKLKAESDFPHLHEAALRLQSGLINTQSQPVCAVQ